MAKEIEQIAIPVDLARKLRVYLGTCPHDQVKEMLAEFDRQAQLIKVNPPVESADAET
jgi:hypothetical protein